MGKPEIHTGCQKNKDWRLGILLSHPSGKNNYAARMGHPKIVR